MWRAFHLESSDAPASTLALARVCHVPLKRETMARRAPHNNAYWSIVAGRKQDKEPRLTTTKSLRRRDGASLGTVFRKPQAGMEQLESRCLLSTVSLPASQETDTASLDSVDAADETQPPIPPAVVTQVESDATAGEAISLSYVQTPAEKQQLPEVFAPPAKETYRPLWYGTALPMRWRFGLLTVAQASVETQQNNRTQVNLLADQREKSALPHTVAGKDLEETETGELLHARGTILAGDFDGDGVTELGWFIDGLWIIDLDHDAVLGEADLQFRFGDQYDAPVVGDWNGDGRDDVALYGPADEGHADEPAMVRIALTNGSPVAPLALGELTARVGSQQQFVLAGDVDGDGTDEIALFERGVWRFDSNRDARLTAADMVVNFGVQGDLPLLADFDGDGIDELALIRSRSLLVDSNRNFQLDQRDRLFALGESGADVGGDRNGDGMQAPREIAADERVSEIAAQGDETVPR